MTKIALTGIAHSGKDTVANYLVDKYGFRKIGFADPLKRVTMELFGLTEAQVYNNTLKERALADHRWPFTSMEHFLSFAPSAAASVYDLPLDLLLNEDHLSDDPLPCFPYLSPLHLVRETRFQLDKWVVPLIATVDDRAEVTPRVLLQIMGTEVFRSIHAATWVHAWKRAAERTPRVVAADCRFQNEADTLHAIGGEVWRVERPGAGSASGAGHVSETALLTIKADRVVSNSGLLTDLFPLLDQEASRMGLTAVPSSPAPAPQ